MNSLDETLLRIWLQDAREALQAREPEVALSAVVKCQALLDGASKEASPGGRVPPPPT